MATTSDVSPTAAPRLSVVIPTLGRPTLVRTVRSLLAASGADGLEILVVGRLPPGPVRSEIEERVRTDPRVRHLPVQFARGDSSEKKNAGFRTSRADVVAFVDDDVEVAPDWPERVAEPFRDPGVGLVSGPSLVPDDLPQMARLAGVTLASRAAGYVADRYLLGRPEPRDVKWSRLIGCNMAFRRRVLDELGGFDPGFWPGEEMLASYRATRAGARLVFHPGAWLYHFPRASLGRFLRQMYGYGATRVRLVRAGVEFEPATIAPALWTLSLAVLAAGSPFCAVCRLLLALNAALYGLAAACVTLAKVRETRRASDLPMLFLIPLMHVAYGAGQWIELARPGKDLSERGQGSP